MMSSGRASPSPCSTARRCSALSVASEGLVIGAGENESGHAPVSTAAPGRANVAERTGGGEGKRRPPAHGSGADPVVALVAGYRHWGGHIRNGSASLSNH